MYTVRIRPDRSTEALSNTTQISRSTWIALIIGLLVMYVPSLYDLLTGIWSKDDQMHGPIVLSISIWLIYRNWPAMELAAKGRKPSAWGWPAFIIGLLLYSLGRSQGILIFEVGSLLFYLIGIILLHKGIEALKTQWFTLFFMLFMIPLPSVVVETMTMPMKMAVSYSAENILYWAGYPIARNGIILQIDQYMLLVADACAGLHTLLTLEALGLLYLNIIRRKSALRNITIAIFIAPISFFSNTLRVIILVLITYHFGDAAGQGFLHEFSGVVLFLSALLIIISLDSILHISIKNIKHELQS